MVTPSLIIPQQLPEFIRAEYPAFVEFLKAYYQWLNEEYALGKLEQITDLDKTPELFVQYFRKQLDIYGITASTENRTFLQHIKELYVSKGSTAGYEFLFKILFNKPSTVIQPWDYVFIPSNGNWVQDTSIIVQPVSGNVLSIGGESVIITDSAGRDYKVFVKNIIQRANNVYELFVTRFNPQSALKSIASIGTPQVRCVVLNTTVRAKVEAGGLGFAVGQVFTIDSYSGTGTLCKVKSVDTSGAITAVDIITFGTGYQSDFNIILTPSNQIDPSQLGSRIQLGDLTYPSNDTVSAQKQAGSIVKHNYTSSNYLEDLTYVGDTVGEITTQPSAKFIGPQYASIKFEVGQLCVYPGYYRDSNNIIGDLVYIQDSYYYQIYSYATVLDESLDRYSAILQQVLHPVGTKHFATYQLSNTLNLSVDVDPTLNILVKDDVLRSFVSTVEELIFAIEATLTTEFVATDKPSFDVAKLADGDTFTVTDATALNVNKVLANAFTTTDLASYATTIAKQDLTLATDQITQFNVNRVLATQFSLTDKPTFAVDFNLEDQTSITDILGFNFEVPAVDVATVTDALEIILGFEAADTVSTSTLLTITSDKYRTDGVQTSNGMSGLYMTPYYVEQTPPYWQAGYLENEREITN